MKFLVITHVIHKQVNDCFFAYGPYVKEMNLWIRYTDDVTIIAPVGKEPPGPIDLPYGRTHLRVIKVDPVSFTTLGNSILSIARLPKIFLIILRQMRRAQHIHLRCPGNMGLIGCFAQIFFPKKIKTAKYAANWDPHCKQPFTYRIQQELIRNTFLTKNMTGLVYGVWPDHTINIKPFFTASYTSNHLKPLPARTLNNRIDLLFVGLLREGKNPMLSARVCQQLNESGIEANLHIYGEGIERRTLEKFAGENKIQNKIILHGNQPQFILQQAYQNCHFLIFLSRSEGWPKAVAEAMWWGCLPITSPVSCVPEMIGFGERGDIVHSVDEVCERIRYYKNHSEIYRQKAKKAAEWAREYTIERFESEIRKIIQN